MQLETVVKYLAASDWSGVGERTALIGRQVYCLFLCYYENTVLHERNDVLMTCLLMIFSTQPNTCLMMALTLWQQN